MGNIYVRGITVKNGILFAAADENPQDRVYIFNDQTQSWQISGSIQTTFQFSIYSMYSYDNFLFVSYPTSIIAGTEVLFRSSDNGVSWQDVSLGLPDGVFNLSSGGNSLFAATVNGVYRSSNSGTTWINSGLNSENIVSLEISGDSIYAGSSGRGVFRSTDMGLSWQNFGIQDKWVYDLKILNGKLFAGTNFVGMFRSPLNSVNWSLINSGIYGMPVNSFAQTNNSIIAGAYGGLFISTNMGISWQDKGKSFPGILSDVSLGGSHLIYDVAVDTINNIIYGGSAGAVYRSTDNGESWTITGATSFRAGRIEVLEISYLNPGQLKVFAGKGTGADFIGLHTSVDLGLNWNFQNFGIQFPYILDVEIKDNLIFTAGGYSVNGAIRRSSDNGISWQTVNNGLPSDFTAEALHTMVNGNIITATDNGVYRSSNNGESWISVWDNGNVTGFASDGKGYVYASSTSPAYRGIFRSTDFGTSWQQFNEGFQFIPDNVFSVTYKNGFLFAGVDRLGIWKRQVDNFTSAENISSVIPTEFILEQNFPNPFNPSTNIRFTVPETGFISLKVYDILGKEISTLVNNKVSAGTHEVQFDAASLTSGVYFYKLQSDEFSEIKKMTLIR
ncbi:MAG: T9SS type A sorting domain-containing protein [Ignavibacteriae bacterium]|nr:T9SS type A sorting domain-containing protein [Ignavibacteriota bacterium]